MKFGVFLSIPTQKILAETAQIQGFCGMLAVLVENRWMKASFLDV
jgi:hypothetical protein